MAAPAVARALSAQTIGRSSDSATPVRKNATQSIEHPNNSPEDQKKISRPPSEYPSKTNVPLQLLLPDETYSSVFHAFLFCCLLFAVCCLLFAVCFIAC